MESAVVRALALIGGGESGGELSSVNDDLYVVLITTKKSSAISFKVSPAFFVTDGCLCSS